MDPVISYIIRSMILSGVLAGYYHIALRNKKFHAYNRFYLLSALVASLVFPFIHFTIFTIHESRSVPLRLLAGVFIIGDTPGPPTFHLTPAWVAIGCSVAVSVVLLGGLLFRIRWIYRVRRASHPLKMPGYTLVPTDVPQAPFSFLQNLFWQRVLPIESETGKSIMQHELTHIRQRHTYDKLFTQLAVCIYWINPFFWYLQRELNIVHEFLADAGSIAEGDAESFAIMLLESSHNEKYYRNPAYYPVAEHYFFHSSIKRRLFMITQSNKTRYSGWRQLLVLPVIALLLAVFSFATGQAQTDPKKEPPPISVIGIRNDTMYEGRVMRDTVAEVTVVGYLTPVHRRDTARIRQVRPKIAAHGSEIVIEEPVTAQIRQELAREERKWITFTIQNPPDCLYYLDGKAIGREQVRQLDPGKIRNANISMGPEAIKKYGQAGSKGVVLFTTN
jgi:hypothetical protein